MGVLDRYYAFNSFFKSNLACSFSINDIPKVKDKKDVETDEIVVMSLREAVRKMSVGTGQGFVKCNCAITAKCSTTRCSCKNAKISCSSKCHGKSPDAKCTNTDNDIEIDQEVSSQGPASQVGIQEENIIEEAVLTKKPNKKKEMRKKKSQKND